VGYTISAFASQAGDAETLITTSATHELLAGEPITITNSTDAYYDGAYIVLADGLDGTHFAITKAYVAKAGAGSVRRPATLKCLKGGIYKGDFCVSGNCANTNDVFKMELNRNLTPQDNRKSPSS